jgi:hypothetical protein
MDFETKEEKLYSDLLDKAFDDFFLKNETNTRCPVCNELVQVWETKSCYGTKCKCVYMDSTVRGL